MAIKTGLAAYMGLKAESVYGTAVTVDRFFYFESGFIVPISRKRRVRARGAGIVNRTNLTTTTTIGGRGQFVVPVMDKSFGIWNKILLGANTSAQVGGTTEYTHTGIIDLTTAMQGVSYTVQIVVPGTDGTLRTFTGEGGKCTGWELKCDEGGNVTLMTDWDFENVVTNTSAASVSYPSGWTPYVSEDCAVTIGGSSVFARSWSIKGAPTFDVDRRGQSTVQHKEPLWVGPYIVTAELDCEFEDLTHVTSWLAGTQAAAVITATGDTIPAESNPYKMTATFGKQDIVIDGDPKVNNDGIVRQKLTLEALNDGSTAPFTLLWNNADSTA